MSISKRAVSQNKRAIIIDDFMRGGGKPEGVSEIPIRVRYGQPVGAQLWQLPQENLSEKERTLTFPLYTSIQSTKTLIRSSTSFE